MAEGGHGIEEIEGAGGRRDNLDDRGLPRVERVGGEEERGRHRLFGDRDGARDRNPDGGLRIELQGRQILDGIREMTRNQMNAMEAIHAGIREGNEQNTMGFITKPKVFTGDRHENVGSWLRKFNEYAAFAGWDDDRKCLAFPVLISDRVKAWYYGLRAAVRQHWDALSESMVERYGPARHTLWERADMLDRKQGRTESVEEYTREITKILDLFDIGEPERKNIYIKGLRKPIQIYVCEEQVQNMDAAERRALNKESQEKKLKEEQELDELVSSGRDRKLIEQVFTFMNNKQQEQEQTLSFNLHAPSGTQQYAPTGAQQYVQQQRPNYRSRKNYNNNKQRGGYQQQQQNNKACWRCLKTDHGPNECWVKEKRVRCFICSNVGHLQAACRFKDAQTNANNQPAPAPQLQMVNTNTNPFQ